MLTVTLGWLASGKRSTLRPLARSYSLMPSTEAPALTPAGSAAPAAPTKQNKAAANKPRKSDRDGDDMSNSLRQERGIEYSGGGPLGTAWRRPDVFRPTLGPPRSAGVPHGAAGRRPGAAVRATAGGGSPAELTFT